MRIRSVRHRGLERFITDDDARGIRHDLVNGKAALSAEMALRIEKAFGVDMDTLLRMQAWFDSYAMRERAGDINVERFDPPSSR